MEARARVLLVATVVLSITLAAAPAALAVPASVRVEGAPYQVAPPTAVDVPAEGAFTDTDGTSFAYTRANAFAALDLAASLRGLTYHFNMDYGAPFLETVAGLTWDPADFSNGWTYMVNGVGYPILDMGAADFLLEKGDRVVFTQNPDATFSRGAKLLRLRFMTGRAVTPGSPVVIVVLGDDVARANSAAEATRYGLDPVADPALVERPAAFASVVGAAVHVGSRVYVDGEAGDAADGMITVSDLPRGTYGVWAEKTMDGSYTYVRSAVQGVNVDYGPRISSVRARAMLTGARLAARVAFTVDKRCDVRVKVVNRHGGLLAVMKARDLSAGRHSLTWGGVPSGSVTGRLSFVIAATDTWGRVTTTSVAVSVAR